MAASFAGLAALVVTTVGVAGYAASIDYSAAWAQPRTAVGPAISIIDTAAPTTASVRNQLQDRLPETTVVGFDADTGDRRSQITFFAGCRDLRTQLSDLRCEATSAGGLSVADELRVRRWVESTGLFGPETRIVLRPEGRNPQALAVISNSTPDQLDEQIRTVVAMVAPISIVRTVGVSTDGVDISWWLTTGLMLADVILLLSCMIAVTDRLLAVGSHHQNLHLIGASDRQLHRLFSVLFAAPYAVIVAAAFAIGLFVCNVLRYRAPTPSVPIIWIAAGMVVIGLVGAIATRRIATTRLLASRD